MADPVMKLSSYGETYVAKEKITEYLLNLDHDDGKSKAKFFLARGFTLEHWESLVDALRQHAIDNEIAKIKQGQRGQKFIIECNISTPDQKNPCIRTVWALRNGETAPRLITAYPHL